jgi:predicted metal-dependent hydrolase
MNNSIQSPVQHSIPVRRLSFDFQQAPKYYFNHNPLISSLLTAMSLTFPTGERFFVHTVRSVRDQVHNQQLQKDVSGFIGQEAMHSHAHEGFNDFVESLGLDTQKIIDEEEQAVAFIKRKLNAKQQLAITCALEHFTAIIAHYLLTTPQFSQQLDPSVARLWMWHALEETEHKAVAFDVYQEVFADQKTRKLLMRIITCTFFTRISQLTLRLLLADPIGRKQWRQHLDGLAQLRTMIRTLAPAYLQYYQDNFHPDQQDSSEITAEWRHKLFGTQAA